MSERAKVVAEQIARQALDDALKTFRPLGKAHADLLKRCPEIIQKAVLVGSARIDELLKDE